MSKAKALDYADKVAAVLNNKFPAVQSWERPWSVDTNGVKYFRVVHDTSVYCFLDSEGNVYKPASWKAPVKDARYNVSTPEGLLRFAFNADRYTGCLYKNRAVDVPEGWEPDFEIEDN